MNVDELKQSLTMIADEARDQGAASRLEAVNDKVSMQRRTTTLGVGVAALTAAALTITPNLINRSPDETPPAGSGSPLPAVVDKGTSFYTQPAGARLIGHVVAKPGSKTTSFTFTPSTLDLSWEQFCWDRVVKPTGGGAEYSSFVNGHPLGSSLCQHAPGGSPISGTSFFGSSPRSNVRAWKQLGVRVGEPSTFTARITGRAGRAIAPQLGAGVYERGPQQKKDGVWFDRQVVSHGHTYRVVAAEVAQLSGTPKTTASIELPSSEHELYVFIGAAHVHGGLRVLGSGGPAIRLPPGSPGGGTGDLLKGSHDTATVSGWSKAGHSTGQVYVVAYERID